MPQYGASLKPEGIKGLVATSGQKGVACFRATEKIRPEPKSVITEPDRSYKGKNCRFERICENAFAF